MSLEFSVLHLVIGDNSPSADVLRPAFSDKEDNYSDNGTLYSISKENLNDKYFWFSAKYGISRPYSETVYNTKDRKEEQNPRKEHQIERGKQLFGLYCINRHELYLSNTKNKSWLKKYLGKKLSQEVVIKAFLKSMDEFIKQIKSIEKVKFVTKKNLFNSDGEIMNIFPNPKDLYGLGVPESFTLEANFANARPTPSFIQQLRKMVRWKNNCEASLLLCIGRDDKSFETIFNIDSLIQKLIVEVAKDDQGFYDPIEVRQALITEIKDKYETNP